VRNASCTAIKSGFTEWVKAGQPQDNWRNLRPALTMTRGVQIMAEPSVLPLTLCVIAAQERAILAWLLLVCGCGRGCVV
jgi:hypothetical protein